MTKADDFDMFYAATSRRLVRQIFAMTGDLSEAEDAVQEAYIRAWRRWPRIRAYDDPEAWLRVVAYRITVNSWQKARNRLTAHRAGRHHELPGLSRTWIVISRHEPLNPEYRAAGARLAWIFQRKSGDGGAAAGGMILGAGHTRCSGRATPRRVGLIRGLARRSRERWMAAGR
jgi:hypothetical protein